MLPINLLSISDEPSQSSPRHNRFREGLQQMAQWILQGRLKFQETVVNGLENAPTAFIGLFHGENVGKQLVRVSA